MKGLFIAIEGIDGVGKSTCAKALSEELKKRYPDREVALIKTPGETEAGKEIRKIVLSPELSLCNQARFLMFVADMYQVTEEVVKPVLDRGGIVISDRYRDSTFVYQIACTSLNQEKSELFEDLLLGMTVTPDMVFVLDFPVEDAKERILLARKKFADAFELASEEIWRQRRDAFQDLVFLGKSRYTLLPASRPTDDLVSSMIERINLSLKEKDNGRKARKRAV